MTGNRALLMNFVEKFLETVLFGNNDFAVIAGYGDVVIGSMMIKRVYYVEGLGHNLFNVRQFCNKGLEVAFIKSTCFVRTKDGVDLLTGDRSLNLYTISLNEVAPNSLVDITQQFSAARTPQQNGVVERRNRTLVKAARTMLTFTNLPLFLWAEAITTSCFTKSRSFYETFESFQEESSSSSLNDDVQQSSDEVEVPSSNTQSILNYMIPNVDEASTSHNVFNECLEDAYFDASTSFHDPSNVHTFYQPYLHEKKWTKDHPHHKIIGDPKSSVRTRGHLANSCLFSCLLSSIEPAIVAEALRDTDWASVMILMEEVYVGQPLGFVSTRYPYHVYALDKALYGLKQAPRAWYDVLSQFLIDSDFQKGDKLVCWSSKKQNCVSISTAESEYVAVSGCCAQVLWMRTQLTDYGFFYDKVLIYCDSKSAIAISCNPVQHTRTKHIDVKYHFIKDHVEKGTIELYFVGTEYQLADLFTKFLPEARFKFLVEKLGMMSYET
nr:retrovirus-related Pol polyprotein from transposon TNT 1-94 [Tanacetum cinerariifolium]